MTNNQRKLTQVEQQLVDDALKSLLYEVVVLPKPGLVDPVSSGPHPDMDVFTFIDSAISLRTYFENCAVTGTNFSGYDLTNLFQEIRLFGIKAEKTMFAATNNANTHKGAIFSLGIFVTGKAYCVSHPGDIFEIIQRMLTGLTKNDFKGLEDKPESQLTAGEKEYLKYGSKGIRGEAEAGFPTVQNIGLPALKKFSGNKNDRLLNTLLIIAEHSFDSNLVKRAGSKTIIPWVQKQIGHYFELGARTTLEGRKFLDQLNQEFLARNLSLGGSADLLILTIFMGLQNGILKG